jgi:hypothetical protein
VALDDRTPRDRDGEGGGEQPPSARQPMGRGRKLLMAGLGLAGLAFSIYLVWYFGVGIVAEQVATLGAILPAVLLVTGVRFPMQAAGWRLAIAPRLRPGWTESIVATLASDALGYLTFAGPVAGEPVKAYLMRHRVPLRHAIVTGAVERTIYSGMSAVVMLIGLVLAGMRVPGTNWLRWTAVAVAGLAAFYLLVRAVLAAGRRGSRAPRAGDYPQGVPGSRQSAMGETRAVIADLWHERPAALVGIVITSAGQHIMLVAEAYLMLAALGAEPTLTLVLIFEGLNKAVNAAGTFIPGRLGVFEGGNALLAGALGVGATFGLSLSIMRRARAVIWGAAGAGLFVLQAGRAARAVSKG